jgi:hypothetical protein
MMYRATYSPDFYRALHALVHAEFRGRRALDLLSSALHRKSLMKSRTAREVIGGVLQTFRRPALKRRVEALARQTVDDASVRRAPVLIPVLSQQAAAVPSEQPR